MTNPFDAINAAAQTHQMRPCYDSGPAGDGRLLVLGDDEYCDDYLNGRGTLGRRIEISFTTRGTIDQAVEKINNKVSARVPAGGDTRSRLRDTLNLFSPNR